MVLTHHRSIAYGTNRETYLDGSAEDAAELMGILVKGVDADARNVVITHQLSDITAAEHSSKTVALQPAP